MDPDDPFYGDNQTYLAMGYTYDSTTGIWSPPGSGIGGISPDPSPPQVSPADPSNPYGFGGGKQMIDPTQQAPVNAPVPPADIFPGFG